MMSRVKFVFIVVILLFILTHRVNSFYLHEDDGKINSCCLTLTPILTKLIYESKAIF
jgi:hypothetical protein